MSLRREEAFANAGVHLRAGRLETAAGILLQVLTPDIVDPMLWCVLAWIFEAMGRDGEAVGCYRKALDQEPGHAFAKRGLADLRERYVDLGRLAEAEDRIDEAATAYGTAVLFGAEGEARARLERLSLQRLGDDTPAPSRSEQRWLRFFAARHRLAKAAELLQSGNAAQALRLFRQFETATDDPESIYAATARLGAKAAASRVPKPPPTLPGAARILAEVDRLAGEGRIEEAAAVARRGVEATSGPRAVQERWQELRFRLFNPSGRLVLPELGAVEVASDGAARRIRLLDRPARGKAISFHYPVVALAESADPMLFVHSAWEAREVPRALLELGYDLDIVPMEGGSVPADAGSYDVVFSLHGGFARRLDLLAPGAKRLLMLTGSAPAYQNRREAERVAALAARRPGPYAAKRSVDEAGETRALELADHAILLGNRHTLGTYDAQFHPKTSLLAPTGSLTRGRHDPMSRPPDHRSFFWHGGTGVVLKGLDRVLDATMRHPDWMLDIVGYPYTESDFDELYKTEFYETPSIRLHGGMPTNTRNFRAATARCFAFVSPAASEATSIAAVTCLELGLYPIVSRDVGVDLPDGCGIVLETCEVDEIEQAMARALALAPDELARQTLACQRHALEIYSREGYARQLRSYLKEWLG